MRIFMLSGYAGSGKDTVGKILIELGYKRYAFADALKHFSADLHKFSFDLTQTETGKQQLVYSPHANKTASVRTFLIEDSAKAKVDYNDPAYWARITAQNIKDEAPLKVVITDWRYTAEIEHIMKTFPQAQIITFRIVRPGITPLADPSEHELDNAVVDLVINNNCPLSVLQDNILQAHTAFTSPQQSTKAP